MAVGNGARAYPDPTLTSEQREGDVVIFRALHQYLGVGVGEHLGYQFTGIWSILIENPSVAVTLLDVLAERLNAAQARHEADRASI